MTRYRMLETVRQYAHDRLLESGGEVQWRDRHLAHFLALGEESASEMIGGNQQPWIDRLAIEQDNFRAALAWSASAAGNAEDGLRLANALARFWVIRWNGADTHGWFTRLLAIVPRTSAGRTRANALNNLGIFEFSQGEPAAAEALYREALGLYRELDYTKGIASALNNLGCVAIEQARYAEAEALFDECLTINRAIDYTQEAGRALMNLGVVARARGDLARAREFLEEALSLLRDSGNQDYIAEVLYSLGHVECEQGNYSLAEARLRESVTMFQGLDNRNGIAQGLECLARVGVATGASTRGARLWGTAERVREEIGHPMLINHRPSYNRAVDSARTALGDEAFTLAWREGRAIKLEDAVKYALSGEDTPPRH